MAQFLHVECFSHATSKFIQAIKKGHLSAWPGLTEDLISKHLPLSPATTKVHLKQEFKNLRPTTKTKTDAPLPDPNPEHEELLSTTHDCFMKVISKEEGVTHPYLAGRYPIKSARGNRYIFICYDYDSNTI